MATATLGITRTGSSTASSVEAGRYRATRAVCRRSVTRLSREEIVDVLTYVKSLWGDKAFQGQSIRETQALVSENDRFPPTGG